MTYVSFAAGELLRIAALERYTILDTAAEQSFDRLTAFAARTLDMPLAFISLIDRDRQWFKSRFGIDIKQTDRDVAFCNYTISSSAVMVVADALDDERFVQNPLVTGEPNIRFYAGAPLQTKDGYNLGALCVADTQPHHSFTQYQRDQLAELAFLVMELLENRLVTQVLKKELLVERKALEGKLTDSEKRFHLLAQNSKDIILVTSPDGIALYVSPACQAVLDYAPEELVGQSVYQFIHEEELADLQNAYALASKFSNLKTRAFRFRAKNGQYRWIDLAARPIFDPVTGELVEIQSSCRDITQRKAVEEALKQSELKVTEMADQLQIVVNNAPLFLYSLDQEGKFTFAAGKGLSTLGLQPDKLVGQSVLDLYANNPPVLATIRRVLGGESFSAFIEEAGMAFESFYSPVKDANGKVVSVIGVSINITEKKQAEKALQREQEFALQVMGNMGQGLTVLDSADLTIKYANPAMAKMLGYSIEELTGKTFTSIIPLNYHARLRDERLLRLQGKSGSYEVEMVRKDGWLIPVNIASEGIYQEGNLKDIIIVNTDLTERKQVEQGLRLALEKEKELGELKDRIISTASHEFRTPLSVIISSVELLEFYSHKWSEDKKLEILGRITQASHKLTNLVEDILIYNRADAGHLECVRAEMDLTGFCTKLIEELQLSVGEDKEIRLVERGERQKAFLDVKLLGYIFNNLLSNALKYSRPGGKVELELNWNDGEVIFRVKDQGIGIPLKDQASLFEPFQRASNVGSINGSGFGLAIVKRGLLAHGGTISLNSLEGSGSTFTVTLPLSAPEKVENPALNETVKENDLTGELSSRLEFTNQMDSTREHWWLLERAIEASSSGIILTNPTRQDNPLVYVSKGFERMTGFLSEEVLGQNYRFLQGEDRDQEGLVELRQALAEERDCRVTLRNYRKNGSLIWTQLQLSAVRNPAGKLTYFVGIQTDISDRVKAEQALNRSEQKFKTLVENTPDAIAQFDRQGKYLYVNPGMVKNSHGTLLPERIIGKSMQELGLSPQRITIFHTHLNIVLETGKLSSFETIQELPGREPEYFQVSMVPEFNMTGKEVISVLTIARDITELKLTYKALQASEAKVSEILHSITDAFFAVDLNWEFTYLNQQAEKLLGHSRQELLGRSMWKVFPGSETSFYREKYQLGMREMVAFHFEEYFPTLGTWFDIHGYPLGEGLSFYFQNITARKEAEEQLKQSERAYRHLMEQASEAIYISNFAGQILEVNEECCKLTGYTREELLQMSIDELVPDELQANKRVPAEKLPRNQTLRGTRQLRRKDGVQVSLSASLRILEDNRVVGIIHGTTASDTIIQTHL